MKRKTTKKQRNNTGKIPKTSSVTPLITAVPSVESDYRQFLNKFSNKIINGKKKITSQAIKSWQEPPITSAGQIQNEIVSKFNKNNKLGVSKIGFNPKNSESFYWVNEDGNPILDLVPKVKKQLTKGPDTSIVAHELVHANDHQIDHLNPLVWKNLQALTLATKPSNFKTLNQSISKIQNKIDPTKAFSSNYPIDESYIKPDMKSCKIFSSL
jgi:hypothetical protein